MKPFEAAIAGPTVKRRAAMIQCLLLRALLIAAFMVVTSPISAEDDELWDDFGVAMSAHEHAAAGAEAAFHHGAGSLRLTPSPLEAPGESFVIDLNGDWHFKENPPAKQLDTLWEAEWPSWDKIAVPADFAMERGPASRAAYNRSLVVPEHWAGRRVKLRFDEVASSATVWFNGRKAGRHVGHFIPFEFDVTDHVKFGDENLITVRAQKESIARRLSGYALHVGGGITRGARLFSVPDPHIAVMHASTHFDDEYRNATLEIDLRLVNEGSEPTQAGYVAIALADSEGKPLECTPCRVNVPAMQAGGALSREVHVAVKEPRHWTAETPHLYDLTVALRVPGSEASRVRRRIGFREIEVRGRELLVNGRPVKLRGSNRHLAHPLRGRSITPERARQDAEWFKAANCNFIRTSHYPPSEEFITACDELGLYVEEEAPFCFFGSDQMQGLDQEDVTRYVTYANLKMVERDRSHPSVVLWSIGNESKWGPHFQNATRAVAAIDPTRPSTFMWYEKSFGDQFQVAASHYPGPNGVTYVEPDKPKIFSEYCHMPAYAPLEMYTDPGVDDRWGELLQRTWDNLYATDGALGGAIWCGIDDVFHVPDPNGIKVQGVAPWGILDGWRRPKPEYWHTLKAYSPFQVTGDRLELSAPGQPLTVPVENRYDFANLSTLKVEWSLAGRRGVLRADVPARSRGLLEIPARAVKQGDVLQLTVTDPAGRLVNAYALPVGDAKPEAYSGRNAGRDKPWDLDEDNGVFVVTRDPVVARIDKGTGLLEQIAVNGEVVVTSGPHLRFVPTFTRVQQRAMKHAPPALIPGYGSNLRLEHVDARVDDGIVIIRWKGCTDEAAVEGVYRFLPNGELEIPHTIRLLPDVLKEGDLVWSQATGQRAFARWKDAETAVVSHPNRGGEEQDVSREEMHAVPRQLGLEFVTPLRLDTLQWKRDGLWTVYPPDHIGRLQGRASAVLKRDTTEALRETPAWPWSEAGSALGTRDFRSTKRHIRLASLTAPSGHGIELRSDGRHSARAYLQPDGVHWLIMAHDGGPSEGFMDNYFAPNRIRLSLGEPIRDTIRIRMLPESN